MSKKKSKPSSSTPKKKSPTKKSPNKNCSKNNCSKNNCMSKEEPEKKCGHQSPTTKSEEVIVKPKSRTNYLLGLIKRAFGYDSDT